MPSDKETTELSNTDDLDLHDAILKSMIIDYPSARITIDIDYYPDPQQACRHPGRLEFSGVISSNTITDLNTLSQHASFGNISYWVREANDRTTYIYLVRGLITVVANRTTFTPL